MKTTAVIIFHVLLSSVLVLSACAGAPAPGEPAPPVAATETPENLAETSPATAVPPSNNEGSAPEPVEVTYFTPAQGEGPYYPVDKPVDRDNDLTRLAGSDGVPAGQVIEFEGRL